MLSAGLSVNGCYREYCLPLVKVGGYFVAYKGEMVEEELSRAAGAFRCLGGKLGVFAKENFPFRVTGGLWFKSRKPALSRKYPRRPGIRQRGSQGIGFWEKRILLGYLF